MFPAFANWLARGDNAFLFCLFVCIPPLLAVIAIGFF